MKKLILTVFLLPLFASVSAQVQYSETDGPPGGKVLDMIYTPDMSMRFALVSPNDDNLGTLYASSWDEPNWFPVETVEGTLPQGSIAAIASSNAGAQLLVLSGDKLYFSVDGSFENFQFNTQTEYAFGGGTKMQYNGLRIFVSGGNQLLYSDDLGGSFAPANIPVVEETEIVDFVVVNQSIYVGIVTGEIYVSHNNGDTFSLLDDGLPTGVQFSKLASTNNVVYALYATGTSDGGIWAVATNGTTWTQVTDNDDASMNFNSPSGDYKLFTSSEIPGRLFLSRYSSMMYKDTPALNEAWSASMGLNSTDQITAFCARSATEMAVGYYAIGVYTGDGTNWELSDGIKNASVADFLLTDGTYLVTDRRGVLRSTAWGFNWERVEVCSNCSLNLFHKLSSGDILLLGSEVYNSSDAGANWTQIASYPVSPGGFRTVTGTPDDAKIWASGWESGDETIVYLSEDLGVNWTQQVYTGMPTDPYRINSIAASSAGKLYIHTTLVDPPHTMALYSVDAGSTAATPVNIPSMGRYWHVQVIGDKVYVVTDDNDGKSFVCSSTDDGANWDMKEMTHTAFKSANSFYICSDNVIFTGRSYDNSVRTQTFHATTDGGDTFGEAFLGYNKQILNKAFIDDSGIAYVARSFGPMMRSVSSVIKPDSLDNVRVVAVGPKKVYLQWEYDGEPVNGFGLDRRDPSDINFKQIQGDFEDGGARRYFIDVDNLEPETLYTYRVKAVNAAGVTYSEEINVTTSALCDTYDIPDNRSWTGTITSGPTVSNLNIKHVGNGYYTVSDLTVGSVATETSKTTIPGTFYLNCDEPFIDRDGDYLMPNGNGSWNGTNTIVLNWQLDVNGSNDYPLTTKTLTLTLNTNDPAPDVPAQVFGYVHNESSIALQWTPGNYQASYVIARASAAAGPYVEIDTVEYPETTYVNEGLTLGSTYHYKVKARNANASPIESAYITTPVSVVLTKPNFVLANTIVNDILSDAIAASWGDIDNDGFDDLVMTEISNETGPYNKTPLIFRNNGAGDFEDKTGILPEGSFAGAVFGDVDNDGDADVFMPTVVAGDEMDPPQKSVLLKNEGNFTFTNLVNALPTDPVTYGAASANWIDFNKDGKLDLFVPFGKNTQKLYAGTASGFSVVNSHIIVQDVTQVQVALWFDFDFDNDLDVFVVVNGSDGEMPDPSDDYAYDNALYINKAEVGGGYEKSMTAGFNDTADDIKFQTASLGDYDGDGDFDIYICVQNGPNLLYRNNNNGTFSKQPAVINTPTESKSSPSFGANWGDIDNDGDQDLVVLNPMGASRLYINDGAGNLTKSGDELLNRYISSFTAGAAFSDYDNNGTLDLVMTESTNLLSSTASPKRKIKLLKNNNNTNNWIKVNLHSIESHKSAFGAQIFVAIDGKFQVREIMSSGALGCYNSQTAHFGVGSATVIDSMMVIWPFGLQQVIKNIPTNQTLDIYEDQYAPEVLTVSPADNQSGLSTTTSISIKFNELPFGSTTKKVRLFKVADPTDIEIETFIAADGIVIDSTVTFTPSVPLEGLQQYRVKIDSAGFVDYYGNAFSESNYNWTFITGDATGPAVSFVESSFETPGVGFGTVDVTATATDNVGVVSTKLYYRGIGDDIFTEDAGVAGGIADEWDFTILEDSFDIQGIEYYFTAADAVGNTGRAPASGYFQKFYEDVVPQVSFTAVAMLNKGPATYNFVPTVTDNKSVGEVTMYLRDTKDGVDFIAVSPASVATNAYTFTIPAASFDNDGIEYFFVASDPTGNEARAPEVGTEYYETLLDNVLPSTTFSTDTRAKVESGITAISYTINATDNQGVDSVKFYHKRFSQAIFQEEVNADPTNGQDVLFELKRADGDYDETGLEYYIEILDLSGNLKRVPETGAAKTLLEYPSGEAKLSLAASGGDAKGYQIISIPYVMVNKSIADNFSELGNADKTRYRFLRYSSGPPKRWEEYPGNLTTFNRGEGYFVNTKEAITIDLTLAGAPTETLENPFTMDLDAGWTQIGNPYLTHIDWSDVQAANAPAVVGNLVTFSNGTYGNADGLDAKTGGFVFLENGITGFKIPISTSGRRAQKVYTKDLSASSWRLPFKITQGEISQELSSIGMDPDANNSYDKYDNVQPPRFFDYIEFTTEHPEFSGKNLSGDIVPTQEEHVWEFTVDSNLKGMTELTWDNSSFGENDKQLYLFDESQQMLVDMRAQNGYRFDARLSNKIKIYFGANVDSKFTPTGVMLGKAFPNPTRQTTTIPFTLPTGGGTYEVILEIHNLVGKKVSTLLQGSFEPGYYNAEWDAASEQLGSGIYTYQLIVNSNGKQQVRSGKILVTK